jgi:hypothetical protein
VASIFLLHPKEVKTNVFVSEYAIKKAKDMLKRQGQIVPLVIEKDADDDWVPDLDAYPYGNELVHAARDLKWDTILVTDGDEDT